MPGLDPGIHVVPLVQRCGACSRPDRVDGRVKPGHDGFGGAKRLANVEWLGQSRAPLKPAPAARRAPPPGTGP
ncbi:hypothetical protein FBQ73_02410 [Xanthobacter autotrophicus]|uniref:Uncharacterized protein n=1 Tax=Xanthobacter autotrophicus TaxID=280 RepID=A0A6C1KUX0_XANAU|nr:hypothetical protein FBQ73_02410 [Xanthobacter autotrophicus]